MHYTSIIKFVWSHVKPYRWFYLIMIMAPIISSFYPFAYNYAIKLFLDAMEAHEFMDYQNILFPILLFLGAQFVLDLVWRISNVAEWKSEPYVRRSILVNSYDYVQHHPYKFFQDNFSGAVVSKIKGLLDGYDKFWAEVHHGLGNRVMGIVVNLIALSMVNLWLSLFVWIWCVIYIPIMYHLSKRLNQLSFEETESRHALIGQVSDKITNIISLFSFSARSWELKSLNKQMSTDFIPKQVRTYKADFLNQIVGGILYISMFAFILFYMIHLRMQGLITVGDFAFVFGMTLAVTEAIWHTTVSMQDFARAMGDFKSALSILATPQKNLDKPGAYPLIVSSPTIEFKGVNFSYEDGKVIFKDLNLVIGAGEKIGLVGHTGAGKSSLINLLLKYFQGDQGEILVDGQDIQNITQDSLRQNIAVIPQDTMLFHRRLMDNIRYGKLEASDEEVIKASKEAHIHDYIKSLPEGYDTLVGERGIKLSGGQRQRIAIARAILKDAPILILDEATSALDSQTEKLIQDSLNILIEDKQKTVIAIAHRLSTLKHMDRILVLDKGTIVEEGTHDSLVADENSKYRKLWDLQVI